MIQWGVREGYVRMWRGRTRALNFESQFGERMRRNDHSIYCNSEDEKEIKGLSCGERQRFACRGR